MPETHPLYDIPLSEMGIAVFDLETTGLFPSEHRIIQIATVAIAELELGGEYETKVNPGEDYLPLSDFIMGFTGITKEQIDAAPDISTALKGFRAHVGSKIVAGHNIASFDLPFIRRAEQRTGIEVQSDYYIDTLKLAQKLQDNGPRKLADCARYYSLDVNDDELHDALVDTRLCAELLVEQIKDLENRKIYTFGEMIRFIS